MMDKGSIENKINLYLNLPKNFIFTSFFVLSNKWLINCLEFRFNKLHILNVRVSKLAVVRSKSVLHKNVPYKHVYVWLANFN